MSRRILAPLLATAALASIFSAAGAATAADNAPQPVAIHQSTSVQPREQVQGIFRSTKFTFRNDTGRTLGIGVKNWKSGAEDYWGTLDSGNEAVFTGDNMPDVRIALYNAYKDDRGKWFRGAVVGRIEATNQTVGWPYITVNAGKRLGDKTRVNSRSLSEHETYCDWGIPGLMGAWIHRDGDTKNEIGLKLTLNSLTTSTCQQWTPYVDYSVKGTVSRLHNSTNKPLRVELIKDGATTGDTETLGTMQPGQYMFVPWGYHSSSSHYDESFLLFDGNDRMARVIAHNPEIGTPYVRFSRGDWRWSIEQSLREDQDATFSRDGQEFLKVHRTPDLYSDGKYFQIDIRDLP